MVTSRSWLAGLGPLAIAAVAACGCSDSSADLESCAGVDCLGAGQCLVSQAGAAICVCNPGYHATGLACEPNVPGEECTGVDCSDHGSCLVVDDDPPYPVCFCDPGYHNEGQTNCLPGDGVGCGPGTHLEGNQCVPDNNALPPEFCVPQLRESPGRVVIDSGISLAVREALVWTGSHFLAVYGDDSSLITRTIDTDGSLGQRRDHGTHQRSHGPVYSSDHVAVVSPSGNGAEVLIFDTDGSAFTIASLTAAPRDLVAFRNGFAAVYDHSVLPVAVDGTVGSEQQLASAGIGLTLASNGTQDRIGYAVATPGLCHDLTFSVADASSLAVVADDLHAGGDDAYALSWASPSVFFGADRYGLLVNASVTPDCSGGFPSALDTFVKMYDADGIPIGRGYPFGLNTQFLHQTVWTGRYAMVVQTLSSTSCMYVLLDGLGRPYRPGPVTVVSSLDESEHDQAGVAAYSDAGVGVIYRRKVSIAEFEAVFATYACSD